MRFTVKLSRGVAFGTPFVRIEGDVDPDDAPVLERAAWEAFGTHGVQVILDLESCTHFSSTGLAVLFSLVRWASPKGGKVIVVRPSARVLRMLQLVQLTRERGFQVFIDLDSARETILQSTPAQDHPGQSAQAD
jgi:anti-anti-sigma factor